MPTYCSYHSPKRRITGSEIVLHSIVKDHLEFDIVVSRKSELYGIKQDGSFDGLLVSVTSEKAVYMLTDVKNITSEKAWTKISESGINYDLKDVLEFHGILDDNGEYNFAVSGVKSKTPEKIYCHTGTFFALEKGTLFDSWDNYGYIKSSVYYGTEDPSGTIPFAGKLYVDVESNRIYRWNGSDNLISLGGGADLLLDDKGNVKYDLMPDKVTNVIDAFSNGNLPVVSPKIIVKSMEVTDYKGNNKEQNSAVVTPTVIKDDANKKDYVKVEIGSKIKVGLAFMWTSADNYKVPTEVTDKSDWKKFPEEGEESGELELNVNTTLASSDSLTAEVSADKTGIMVSGSNVVLASGKDTAKRTFEVIRTMRMYYGKTKSVALKESDIEALSASDLVTSRSQSLKDITTDSGEYFVIAYPTLMGVLKSIVLNGQEQLGGFTQSIVSVTNALNYTQNYYVYRSNNDGVFNKDTLVIS